MIGVTDSFTSSSPPKIEGISFLKADMIIVCYFVLSTLAAQNVSHYYYAVDKIFTVINCR